MKNEKIRNVRIEIKTKKEVAESRLKNANILDKVAEGKTRLRIVTEIVS